MKIKRGDIYYVMPKGMEDRNTGGRPAIVIGNSEIFGSTGMVPLVYLVRDPGDDRPGHVFVRMNGEVSVALCEQVWNISADRLGSYAGSCSAAEMAQIDIALVNTLGLEGLFGGAAPGGAVTADSAELEDLEKELEMVTNQADELTERLEKVTEDRDKLNELYISMAKTCRELESENERLEKKCEALTLDVVRMTERADIFESQFRAMMKQVMDGKGEHDGT